MEIGVSGASGHLGKAVMAELHRRGGGHGIVGISRTPETVVPPAAGRHGDYDRPDTLAAAYSGLDRLLIIPGPDVRPGVRDRQFLAAIDAAFEVGVPHVVLVSVAGSRERTETDMYAAYWTAEQYLMKVAPSWTIVRMNYYAESFAQLAPMAVGTGILRGLGENRVAFVSRDDLAAALAGVLTGEGHGGAIYNATGPAAVTGKERAEVLSMISGKSIHFEIQSEEQLRGGFVQAGMPEQYIGALVDIEKHFLEGSFDIVTGDVERLGGRRARSLRDVLAEQLAGATSHS